MSETDMLRIGTPVVINWPSIQVRNARGVITRRRDVLVGENFVGVRLDDPTPCAQRFPDPDKNPPWPYVLPPGTEVFVEVVHVSALRLPREIDGVTVIGPPS